MNKYLDLAWEVIKAVEHEDEDDNNYSLVPLERSPKAWE